MIVPHPSHPSSARAGVVRVALTVDTELASRPAAPENAARVLDVLGHADVRATFFVQGRWASAFPALARRIVDDGHLIGNHTYHHAPLTLMTDEGIRHTVLRAEAVIEPRAGSTLKPWFRCPYGDGEDDPRVLAVLRDLGYRNVPWDVDPHDWRNGSDGRGARDVADSVVAGVLAHGDGARVLLHSWPDPTHEALPAILARLRDEGVTLVRLDELGTAATAPPA
jgi:peptidoglycan/xylan/chitin deacetylase (PgdA/CDA1 family)